MLSPPTVLPAPRPGSGRLAVLAGGLGLLTAVLLAAGDRLPAPPGSIDGPDWSAWFDRLGAPGATMSLVRLGALGATGYLLLVVLLELLGRATERPRLADLAHVLSTPWVTHVVHGLAGVAVATTLTGTTALGATAGAAPAPPVVASTPAGPVPTMHQIDNAPSDPASAGAPPAGPPPSDLPPSMQRLDPEPTPPPTTTLAPSSTSATASSGVSSGPPPTVPSSSEERSPAISAPGALPAPAPSRPAEAPRSAPGGPGGAETWTIGPGDHLWGVAARTLAAAWDRAPSDAAIARYVTELVEANRGVLVVPDDADLVLPGQVFTLPPVPAR